VKIQTNKAIPDIENQRKEGKEIPEDTAGKYTELAISGYLGGTAANWAYDHYNTYSTDYPKLTEGNFSDCTNFVSQAMRVAGGLAMQDDWYCYKKNSTYPTPTTVEQLNYSWNLADPSPWTAIRSFSSYWGSEASSTIYSYGEYTNYHESIYNSNILLGDVVIFHKGVFGWVTIPTHAMIISRYDSTNKDFKLAGHSNERQAYPLLDALENNTSYVAVEFICFPR
jgi:hypothetical protein